MSRNVELCVPIGQAHQTLTPPRFAQALKSTGRSALRPGLQPRCPSNSEPPAEPGQHSRMSGSMAASDEFSRHLGQSLHPALCGAGLLARGAQPGTGRHHRRSTRLSWLDEGLAIARNHPVAQRAVRSHQDPGCCEAATYPGKLAVPATRVMIPLLRASAVGLDFTIPEELAAGSGDAPESHTLP